MILVQCVLLITKFATEGPGNTPMAEPEEDFSTIEHDFLHTKDYFSNYKFPYKERKSRLDFYQNIHSVALQDTTPLLESAKAQLVEVKQQYKELDQQIKALSLDIYATDLRLYQKKASLEALDEEEKSLREELEQTRQLDERMQINSNLNEELGMLDTEIKSYYDKINQQRNDLECCDLVAIQAEETELRAQKQELLAKQKRLTVLNTDSYIEDLYLWHQQLQKILEGIFGFISVRVEDNRLIVHVSKNGCHLEMMILDQILIGCTISGEPDAGMLERFNNYKEECIASNNMMLLIARVFFITDIS